MSTNELQSSARRGRRRNAMVALLLGSTVAMVGAGAMSLAQFTDTGASSGSWTAGTIVLGVSPSTAFTATGILPGASGSATITVANSGSGDLRYAMSSTFTNTDSKGLAAQIDLTIKPGSCPSVGTAFFTGTLATAAFGSNAQGADSGDRNILAGATEDLCFAWSFPLASDNSYKLATTTVTFTFDAEQTLHNP